MADKKISQFTTDTSLDGTEMLAGVQGGDNIKVSVQAIADFANEDLDLSGKQNTLVSGTNIKTVNGESLLGSGDIEIEGGSSDEDATPTTFAGSIKVDKRNRVYKFNISDLTNPITIDTEGLAEGKGATVIITNDDDTADDPEFEDVVIINNVTFDPTEGNSTAYILNNVTGTIVGSVIRLGVAVVTPTLSTPSFTATAVSDTQINLTGISYDSDSESMIIRRATNVGMSANLATIYTGVPKASHNDTGRTASTQYFYDIQTTATGFTDSARGTGNATTQAAGLTQLATPTLSAAPASTTAITLTLGTVANESSYKLEWSANGSTGWTQIGGTIAANTTTYNHTGLTPNTAYFYRLTAVGDGVTYSDSGYGTDDATTNALTQLATPTLTATVISDTEIDLDWTNVANESSFKLERSLNGTTGWTQIGGTIAANTLAYSDTGLTASTHYYYRLSAIGDGTTYSTSGFATDDDTTQAASGYSYGGITDWAFLLDASLDVATTGTDVTSWKDQVSGTVLTARGTAPVYDPVNEFMSTTPGGSAFSLPALTLPGGTSAITVIAIIAGSVYGQSVVAALGGSHLSGTPSTGGAYLMKDQPTPGSGYYSGVANGNVGYNSVDIQYDASGNFDLIRFEVDRTKASNEATIYKNPASTAGVVSLSNNNSNTFTTGLKLDIFGEWNGSAVSDSVRGAIAFFGIVPRILTSGEVSALYTQLITDKGGLSPNF